MPLPNPDPRPLPQGLSLIVLGKPAGRAQAKHWNLNPYSRASVCRAPQGGHPRPAWQRTPPQGVGLGPRDWGLVVEPTGAAAGGVMAGLFSIRTLCLAVVEGMKSMWTGRQGVSGDKQELCEPARSC